MMGVPEFMLNRYYYKKLNPRIKKLMKSFGIKLIRPNLSIMRRYSYELGGYAHPEVKQVFIWDGYFNNRQNKSLTLIAIHEIAHVLLKHHEFEDLSENSFDFYFAESEAELVTINVLDRLNKRNRYAKKINYLLNTLSRYETECYDKFGKIPDVRVAEIDKVIKLVYAKCLKLGIK